MKGLVLWLPLLVSPLGVAIAPGQEPSGQPAGATGPIITFTGFATPSGMPLPTTQFDTGSGFMLVIEGHPGPLNRPVGTSTFDPAMLPDLQVQVTQGLGGASTAVCDTAGGVPATSPPDLSYADADAVNDLACRFTSEGCLVNQFGEPVFFDSRSTVQFCALIGPTLAFPSGQTVVTMRLRNVDGVVGPVQQLTVQVGAIPPTPTRTPAVTAPASVTPTHTAPPTPSASATRTAFASETATVPVPTATRSAGPSATRTAFASHTPTLPVPTATGSAGSSATPAPATATAMATVTHTAGTLIDLDSLIRALFSPTPPAAADVNGDQRVTAADVTQHRLRVQ